MTKVILEKYAAATDSYGLVQEENDTAYLYFYVRPKTKDEQIRAVWLRNYKKAQNGVDREAEKKGFQPMMPAKATKYPEGSPKLRPEDLELVFLDDMDGIALYEKGELMAVIPGWAGRDGFSGYSRDATGASIFAHELGSEETNEIFKKAEEAKALWNAIGNDKLWETYRDGRVKIIEERFGKNYNYFAIGESGDFPPKAIVEVEKDDAVYLITIGLAVLAQPTVEQYTEQPENLRRFELGFAVQKDIFKENRPEIMSYILGISTIPWAYTTFLGEGHTLMFDAELKSKNEFTNTVLLGDEKVFAAKPEKFRQDSVNLLWIVPISAKEQKTAEEQDFKKLMEKAKEWQKVIIFNEEYKFS